MPKRALFSYASKLPGAHRLRQRDTSKHESWMEAILPADAEAAPVEISTNRKPLLAFGVIILATFVVLTLQLARLQIVEGARNLGLAEGNRINQKITRAPRGVIYDRNKTALAKNVASFDLTITPQLVPKDQAKRQQIFTRVSEITGADRATLEQLAAGTSVNPLQPQLVLAGLERQKALLFDQESDGLTGFSLDINPIRQYFDDGLMGIILGYTGRVSQNDLKKHPDYLPTDYIGKDGVESQYDELLRGKNGSEQTEVDSARRPIKVLDSKEAVPGSSLLLTIDKGLQAKMTETLTAALARSSTRRAAGVAMNPKTGEILAMVSLPGYDSNTFAKGIAPGEYSKLANDQAQPLFNKAMSGTYATGSIIKPLVAAAALQEKAITPNTTITDKGFLEVQNPYNPEITYRFHSYEHSGLGTLNLYRALALSSNVYFFTIGGGFGDIAGLGVSKLTAWYNRFGLGSKTGIDLPAESAGRVPTPDWKKKTFKEPWYTGDTYNISVGQGDFLASPLQMAVALSSIANGGNIMKPYVLKQIIDNNGQVTKDVQPEVVRKLPLDGANIAAVKEGMRQVIADGTGCCYIQPAVPVPVSGKTGTAETDPGGKRKPHAWFEAFAPSDDPQIVIVALVENAGEGSSYAAPAVRDMLAWYFSSR